MSKRQPEALPATQGNPERNRHRSEERSRNLPQEMTNRQLAEELMLGLSIVTDAVMSLQDRQEKLEARLAFLFPTQSDVSREVEEFIHKSLAA